MSDSNHPEMHVNEEPRDDFSDVAMGFAVFFTCMCVVAIIATIIAM